MRLIRHFIGNKWVETSQTFATTAPATQEVLAQVCEADLATIARVSDGAAEAFEGKSWRSLPVKQRAQILLRVAARMEERLEDLARLESMDTGKPIFEARHADIPRAIQNFRFFAQLAQHDRAETYMSEDGSTHTSWREPLGPCALITPWNLPLHLATWKIAPALVQGNTVVLKPAEWTPCTADALAQIFLECDVPPGVFNVVHGHGPGSAGEFLVRSPKVRAVSFTGETRTGSAIMAAAAATLKRVSFELGGKGATVIFGDADLERAVASAVTAATRNQGQVCLAGSRLLVERSLADTVKERLCQAFASIKIGDPLQEDTRLGALISIEHRDRVLGYVERERRRVLVGGKVPILGGALARGAFLEPTILDEPEQTAACVQEEIFGPVLTVQSFDREEEALSMLNGTPYGLSCSIWTSNIDRMQRMTRGARTGLVWQNDWFVRNLHSAFGGMKQSGVGREGGQHSLDFFSEYKTVCSAAPAVLGVR